MVIFKKTKNESNQCVNVKQEYLKTDTDQNNNLLLEIMNNGIPIAETFTTCFTIWPISGIATSALITKWA